VPILQFLLYFYTEKLSEVLAVDYKIDIQQVDIPDCCNVIVGQSHFIKTIEDIYEVLATSAPGMEFGVAFCEASDACLIRHDGNKEELIKTAIGNAQKINAGHTFVIVLRNGYPINVLDRIKNVQEVCRVFAATANPLQVLVAETEQGRGIIGVIDGFRTKGIETEADQQSRKDLLRKIIGYKR
jgi:adenosine/AMP kinase